MPRSFLVLAVAIIALIAGVLFYQSRMSDEASAPSSPVVLPAVAAGAGPVFPSFRLVDVDGVERDFSEWAGKYRLLNFWATWCAPCRREIPLLKAFQEQHGARGFQVIGVAVDFPEEVAAYAEAAEFNYPVLVGQEDAMAIAETSGVEFIGMPFTMIVAADGELLNAHIGEIQQEDLDHIVEVLMRLDAGDMDAQGAREALDSL